MFKTDNSLHVFVSNVTSDMSETLSDTSDNQILILKKDGTASAGTAVIAEDEEVFVAMKDADGNVRKSPVFKFKKANVKGLSYASKMSK